VHVPFQARDNPLGQVIPTGLVTKLRQLAAEIASNNTSKPRWVFLIGGPGNGKSETVQDFLAELDKQLNLNGLLVQELRRRFTVAGLLPRKVEITSADLGAAAREFSAKVGRLMVVQDATATDTAQGNAAQELANDLTDLLTLPSGHPVPVFVACANRGLLARAMNEAYRDLGKDNEVTRLLANVIQASSLGSDTLSGLKPCWPLQADDRFACWPLDVESLLAGGPRAAPMDVILVRAVEVDQWESAGRCKDCSSRELCPFRQSAEWLRDDVTRGNLLVLLRRGELARGQRWNFRDAFSLVAELLVGQWSDFESSIHPCEWVHRKHSEATALPPVVGAALALAMQLYPHGMFRRAYLPGAARAFIERRNGAFPAQPLTGELMNNLAATGEGASTKPIRETLVRDYVPLDPATSTPRDPVHPMRMVEDAFCQSVEQGRTELQQAALARAEDMLLSLLEKAEGEWDLLGRESAVASVAVCLIRKVAGMIAKRTFGVRRGYHALDELLAEYEACLRDGTRLAAVRVALQPLMGDANSRFNLLEVLGQPTAESQPLVGLQGPSPGIRALPAPTQTASTPGHDMPCIEVTQPGYRIPLTFDFFMALQLRKSGCAGSSLPASVRAALDRVRHRYAGELCRSEDQFVDGRTSIVLGTGQKIGVPAPGAPPGLVQA
jgi:hypothetical protein